MVNKPTHRIRRCHGNRDAWCLIALRDDGSEMTSYGGYTTALSLDELLRRAGGLLPQAGDLVELVYYAPAAPRGGGL